MSIKQLSIKHYALNFILLYVVFFFISTLIAFSDINNVNEKIIQTDQNNAQTELIDAIQVLIKKNKVTTEKFSQWDEVHQQITNPHFYSYWQTNRLFNAAILPEIIVEAAVYDKNGNILGQLESATLPNKVAIGSTESYFSIENKIPYLITRASIQDRDAETNTLGYVLTKSKVLTPLSTIKPFNFVDSQSIQSYFLEKKKIAVDQLINYLKFNIKPSDEIHLFSDQLKQVLIRNSIILIFFAFIFYYLMNVLVSRPLGKVSDYIDTLNSNPEFQYIPELKLRFNILELEKVKESLTQYQNKLQSVYINLDDKNKELWQLAHHDALTGTLNRLAFEEQWEKIADLFSESRSQISLILFDVNHFKSINDTYGHPTGDEVLKKIALAIEDTLRKGEKLYRIGGDEFATIIHNGSPEDATYVANRCRNAISDLNFNKQGIKEPVRASIGVAHNNPDDSNDSISDLLWQADAAVYSAKKPGQSHVITYTDEIGKVSSSVMSSRINSIVFDAIEEGTGITMYYQPIVNLEDDSADYYEALLRISSKNNIIPPSEIFKLIEARRLEYEMDVAIFKQIADDFKNGVIPPYSGVSINVSGPSIINHQIVEQLSLFVPYLTQYKIVLEITETSLITHINQASEHIHMLKKLGFKIALDDFGSGYSSISYLSTMPVDIVKFDISLIRQLDDEKQYSIIKHLSAMIRETGHILVAEGIETIEIKEKIKHLGFNYAQGYLFGKPGPKI